MLNSVKPHRSFSHGLLVLISYFCLHVLFSWFILTRPMSVKGSLVQGRLISPFILLPEILKNSEKLSNKNSAVDDLMQTPQTPQLCSAKGEVTLYQPVTSLWRVCSRQNKCRHFLIYCLLQFWNKLEKRLCRHTSSTEKNMLQPSHLRFAFQPSSDQANQSPPFWSRDLILQSIWEVSNRHRHPLPKSGGKFEFFLTAWSVFLVPAERVKILVRIKEPLFWKIKEMSKDWQNC